MVKRIETKFGTEWVPECGCEDLIFMHKDIAEKHEIKCTGFKPKASQSD